MTERQSFDGTLVDVPFGADPVRSVAVTWYRELLSTHDADDVLVLTGSPTSVETVRSALAGALPGAAVPSVTSPIVHATDVVGHTDDRAVLSDAMRRELVHRFVADREWETEYLRRAAAQESFAGDLSDLLETATWQQRSFDAPAELREIGEVRDAFHAYLDDHGHLERGQLIAEATGALADGAEPAPLRGVDAILAVEFEEFVETDRRYLQALAEGRELVCIAERDASVGRTWGETGPIADRVSFSERDRAASVAPSTRPAATAAYFGTGTVPPDPETGSVAVIAAASSDDQLAAVADEIDALLEGPEWGYDDVAVATRAGGTAVTEVVEALERTGIPTASTSVVGFGDDPAIRELLGVVRSLADEGVADEADEGVADGAGEGVADGADEGANRGRERNEPEATPGAELLEALGSMDGLVAPLRRWATESGLKERIVERESSLEARAQFGNVRRAFQMAGFLEDTAFVDATWTEFETVLERAHEYAPRRSQTSSTDLDGGVRVDRLQAIKNESFRAVFLVNLVDGEYPGDPLLTRLFPTERVASMPEYPGVTHLDAGDVAATFPTESTASSRPFSRYHTEHARRRLAVGAGAATERLYCCLYEYEDAALEERAQASRFLTAAYDDLPWVAAADGPEIASEQSAEEYLLSRVDDAVAAVRRANSRDVTVSLDEVEAELGEIQGVLAASGARGDALRNALRARVEFANGTVRRNVTDEAARPDAAGEEVRR